MTSRNKKFLSILVAIAIILLFLWVVVDNAEATSGEEPCVPKDAWTETINHPAVTHEEIVPGTPSQWWNFSPNNHKEPLEGEPAFPVDPRGTWQGPHTNGGPSQDLTGTFQQGNGHGSWFHRTAGTPDTVKVVVDKEAWTETIEHPAVVCDKEVGDLHAFAVNPTCEHLGYIQLNPAEGVQWYLDGNRVDSGQHLFSTGIQTDVYAKALPGYFINPDAVGSVNHPIYLTVENPPTDCDEEPVDEPTETPTDEPTDEPTDTPTDTPTTDVPTEEPTVTPTPEIGTPTSTTAPQPETKQPTKGKKQKKAKKNRKPRTAQVPIFVNAGL